MFAGLLITGGSNAIYGASKSAELLDVSTFQGCEMRDLSEERYQHTQV